MQDLPNFTDFERFDLAAKNLALNIKDMSPSHRKATYAFVRESERIISELQMNEMQMQVALYRLLTENQLEVKLLAAIIRAHGIDLETHLAKPHHTSLIINEYLASEKLYRVPENLKHVIHGTSNIH